MTGDPMTTTIIAWSWGEPIFHNAADRLRDQCEEFGYPHSVERPDLADHMSQIPPTVWKKRCWRYRFIPTFITERLDSLQTDILYLHCDFTLCNPITPKSWADLDIAVQNARGRPIFAAPIFVRNNERARRFLLLWSAFCRIDDGLSEHPALARTVKVMRKEDRSLAVGFFNPPLGSIFADAKTPIRGHKRKH